MKSYLFQLLFLCAPFFLFAQEKADSTSSPIKDSIQSPEQKNDSAVSLPIDSLSKKEIKALEKQAKKEEKLK